MSLQMKAKAAALAAAVAVFGGWSLAAETRPLQQDAASSDLMGIVRVFVSIGVPRGLPVVRLREGPWKLAGHSASW